MTKVYVVTDSTADVPNHLIEDLGITVVPLKVHFGDESYLDGQTITPAEFYQKLEKADRLPTTSQPSPLDFVNIYKSLAEEKEEDVHIISIHLSSALSGTYQSAALAKSMVEESIKVNVLDSRKASYAIGIIAVRVAEAAKAGKSADYCLELAQYMIENSSVYFLVDTLQYLQKGGRIGKASALLGSLLNIKPILSIDEGGEIYAKDKVRGSKKAFANILELMKRDAASYNKIRVGLSHSATNEEANSIVQTLKQEFNVENIVVTDIGSVIGAHVGPGTMAFMIAADDFEE